MSNTEFDIGVNWGWSDRGYNQLKAFATQYDQNSFAIRASVKPFDWKDKKISIELHRENKRTRNQLIWDRFSCDAIARRDGPISIFKYQPCYERGGTRNDLHTASSLRDKSVVMYNVRGTIMNYLGEIKRGAVTEKDHVAFINTAMKRLGPSGISSPSKCPACLDFFHLESNKRPIAGDRKSIQNTRVLIPWVHTMAQSTDYRPTRADMYTHSLFPPGEGEKEFSNSIRDDLKQSFRTYANENNGGWGDRGFTAKIRPDYKELRFSHDEDVIVDTEEGVPAEERPSISDGWGIYGRNIAGKFKPLSRMFFGYLKLLEGTREEEREQPRVPVASDLIRTNKDSIVTLLKEAKDYPGRPWVLNTQAALGHYLMHGFPAPMRNIRWWADLEVDTGSSFLFALLVKTARTFLMFSIDPKTAYGELGAFLEGNPQIRTRVAIVEEEEDDESEEEEEESDVDASDPESEVAEHKIPTRPERLNEAYALARAVPISTIDRYLEFKRDVRGDAPPDGTPPGEGPLPMRLFDSETKYNAYIDELSEKLKRDGQKEAIRINVYQREGGQIWRAHLTEGHHRVLAAKRAGFTHLWTTCFSKGQPSSAYIGTPIEGPPAGLQRGGPQLYDCTRDMHISTVLERRRERRLGELDEDLY